MRMIAMEATEAERRREDETNESKNDSSGFGLGAFLRLFIRVLSRLGLSLAARSFSVQELASASACANFGVAGPAPRPHAFETAELSQYTALLFL